ncbi:helix-turn-helix domain-containing protein [Desulfotruncus arcticus]|uniref:helix-turn-helix domain-containing protein n=1 Tax=Desulfotruncus arcticus TaxID=341036 RepID=UPI003EBA4795
MEYYKKENGDIPVLDFLLSLEAKIRAKAFSEIELLEKHGHELREPYVKPIKGKDLFELESNSRRISAGYSISKTARRLLCCFMVSPKKLKKLRQERLNGHCVIKKIMKEGATMSKAGAKFFEVKELLMKDEEFKAEYEKLKPRYDVISQIIEARTSQNITQEELALRVGTQKSNISRLESGKYNPSLDFLSKVARSLGKEVQITLK